MSMNLLQADPHSAALRDAVAQVYDTFRHYPPPQFPVGVCLACCVTPEVERQLREWSLPRLTAEHFDDYNTSAKPTVQSAAELGHFLPRMLELLAEGREIHHSIELSLTRLGNCPEGSWSHAERAALDRFAMAYFDRCLRSDPEGDAPADRFLDDPLSVVLMFDIGGLSVEPLFDMWTRCEDPLSTVLFVETTWRDFWSGETYTNAFATDRPVFQQQLRAWLLGTECRERFAAKFLDADFLRWAAIRPQSCAVPFSVMADGVFDQLTRERGESP